MTVTMLTYTLLTDPAHLEASQADRSPSKGKVYLVVTNTHKNVKWSTIEVTVPGDLTPNIDAITPRGTYTHTHVNAQLLTSPATQSVTFQRLQNTNVFQATPPGGADSFSPGDYMVLALEDIVVAKVAGLAVLIVKETRPTRRGYEVSFAAVPLVKATPKEIPAPRDFRPNKAMLDVGDSLTLSWEGSDDFTYKILFPGGEMPFSVGTRTWTLADPPKRATTYTLVATSGTTPKQEHFLTTTVQVRHPVLETLTATTGIDTPWVQGAANATKGRITFLKDGLDVRTGSGAEGIVHADKAVLHGVNTEWVQGRSADDGKITFPKDGLDVRNGSGAWGTVHADKADLNGINTEWVQGRSADDGWITFPVEGLKVHRKDNSHLTHLDVGYATHDIVKTRVVRGLTDGEGWISFRKEGLNIRRGQGTERGTLFAAKTELKE
ncbi:hypothetical protein ACWEPL_17230 [Nonomuraea sp. NPDC004186]